MAAPYILTIPPPTNIPEPPNNLRTWPGVLERAAAGLEFAIPAGPAATAPAASTTLPPGTIIVPANGTTPATGPPTFTIAAAAAPSAPQTITIAAAAPPAAAPAPIIVPVAPPVPAAAAVPGARMPEWLFRPPQPGFWPAAGLVADPSKPAWYVHPDGQDMRDGKRPVVTWKFT
ncbi:hypothetical protein EX30DRAFT_341535 [Ascodesmis nigricans]|uniref:Uncharacterized protein n=1 Tax=Ascodesmis nigricans TaxID=341454 RepID=A0A4S2MVG2_9PEZI|nr:hypothetical protein EX30DRAFT_341535 [Ascodesmis nigricans]